MMLCIWHLEMCFLIFLNNVNIKKHMQLQVFKCFK